MSYLAVSQEKSARGSSRKNGRKFALPSFQTLKVWCNRVCSKGGAGNRSRPTVLGVGRTTTEAGKQVEKSAQDLSKLLWMQGVGLDELLWGELPPELLERVLAFLPFPNLFRLRTVCKRWFSLILSPQFCQTFQEVPSSWPSYCPVRYNVKQAENGKFHWSAYCKDSNTWQEMPPLSLPCLAGKQVGSGAGGLLCFYNRDSLGKLIVCNPLTQSWKELPPMNQKWRWPSVTHMVMDANTKAYKIIVAGNEAYPRNSNTSKSTEVYDSVSNTWEITGSFPEDLYFGTQDATLHNGLLYCTATKETFDERVTYETLVAYDVQRGVWMEVSSQLPCEAGYEAPLICGDRVVMVVAPFDADGPVGRFYVLDMDTKSWTPLTTMPDSMHKNLGYWGVCVAHGDQIHVVADTSRLVVVYDMAEGSWRELPARAARTFHFITPFSFQPDLDATP